VSAPKFEHYKGLKMNSPIAYTAIKSGIIAITKYLAKYYGKNNIQVNCISPGGIKDSQPKVFVRRYKTSCLSKGLLEINDLQPIVFFLTSDNSKYINGQNIIIDDGWSL
jgi:NAD(P)-dependent dehydrogenase (short-subunit alcohol dehydrogenase family)